MNLSFCDMLKAYFRYRLLAWGRVSETLTGAMLNLEALCPAGAIFSTLQGGVCSTVRGLTRHAHPVSVTYGLHELRLILSTGIFNAILHVNLAALAWLTSATAAAR